MELKIVLGIKETLLNRVEFEKKKWIQKYYK